MTMSRGRRLRVANGTPRNRYPANPGSEALQRAEQILQMWRKAEEETAGRSRPAGAKSAAARRRAMQEKAADETAGVGGRTGRLRVESTLHPEAALKRRKARLQRASYLSRD